MLPAVHGVKTDHVDRRTEAAPSTRSARLRRVAATRLPSLTTLRHYERSWLPRDLVGGLTVGAMLIPQAMGYAALAGLAPQYGFYAAIPALVVYAIVGSSRHLGVGPEPGTAILAAAAVGGVAAGDPARYVTLMAALALLVAGVCVVGALLRLGHLASALSRPVLIGYITGVGLTLLSSQLAAFTGAGVTADAFFPRIWQFVHRLGDIHGLTLVVGSLTLLVLLALRRWYPNMPGALIGVVGATVAAAIFSLESHGLSLVGAIPEGFPTPAWPSMSADDLVALLPAAAGISLVGFTDNVLTARAVARRFNDRIDPNQELFALGAINFASGLSHGFPISSSASRTAVPASLGARSQLVGLVACGFVILGLLVLSPVLANIPRAALAAVIIAAAIHIIDVTGFVELWRLSRSEWALALVTSAGVVVFGVLPGVLVAVGLSLVVALTRMARPHDAVLGDAPGLDGWVDMHEYPTALAAEGLLVFRFDAPLFFINIDRFTDRVEQALAQNPGDEEWLIIDCEGVGAIDVSAVDGLRDLVTRLQTRGIGVIAIARANEGVHQLLRRAKLLEPGGPIRSYPTINRAVRSFRQRPR